MTDQCLCSGVRTAAEAGADGPGAFPRYSEAERRADAVVHVVGVAAALLGGGWLVSAAASAATSAELLSLAVYSAGLAGTLGASALYHLTPAGWWKERFRRIDHAMIFVMIAGSYTPLSLNRLDEGGGRELCAAVWLIALAGSGIKLLYPRRIERVGIALYLGLGWAILLLAGPLVHAVSPTALTLLLAGGVLYTVGVIVHLVGRSYCNVAWHALVLLGAACHFIAISSEFVP